MGKKKRNIAIRKFALEEATKAGHPELGGSLARQIRRRRLWKSFRKKS
jgi:hypothetical protein